MMRHNNKSKKIAGLFLFLVKESYDAIPVYYMVNLLLGIVHAFALVANTWMTQRFFDSMTKAVVGEGVNVYIPAFMLALAVILTQVIHGVHNYGLDILSKKMEKYRTIKLNKKTSLLSAIDYENPETLDTISQANKGVMNAFWFEQIILAILSFYLPYLLFMAVYLFKINPYLPLSLIIVFLPVMATQIIRSNIYSTLEEAIAADNRKYKYYEGVLCDKAYLKETRLLGAFKYFHKIYMETLEALNGKQWAADKKSGGWELFMKTLTLAGYFVILMMLVFLLIDGAITAGAFAAIFASMGMVFMMMEQIICRHIGSITRNLGTVESYHSFMNLAERDGHISTLPKDGNIVLKNVSFSYPKAEKKSLKDISLEIKQGSTVAIVGKNGAGKSTLMRLISGIYLPTEGRVLYGDRDIKTVKPKALFENIAAVFQHYQKYQMTLHENVSISDSEQTSGNGIKASLEKAGIHVENRTFPEGYDTMLSREFDGVDLSGGQWQRIAIARGHYRQHDIIILDEPTAAIDPIEESHIYRQFAHISKGKTAFIVTHRLGSAKIADRIIVMDNAEIVEDGTHDALMAKKGLYHTMFTAQSKWYDELSE